MEQHRHFVTSRIISVPESLNKLVLTTCLLLVTISSFAASAVDFESHVIESLPGYPGPLPIKLETGYIGVGENETVQLFYYFVESERDPVRDPLIFWITGGPGCSGLSAIAYEMGPLAFDVAAFDGSLPSILINPYSWTKVASIIFIDAPAGTGFSYATDPEYYPITDTKITKDNYSFLRKWLLNHPTFIKNRLYVAGDSYGGKIAPMVTLEIAEGNEAGLVPRMNILGYMVGNSLTDQNKDYNERVPYIHRMALISDEYFELAKSSCNGEYVNPDPDDYKCLYALQLIKECFKLVNEPHILEPKCKYMAPRPNDYSFAGGIFPEDVPDDLLVLSELKESLSYCRNYNYVTSYVWADDASVREALHIRKGTIGEWKRCNKTLSYEADVDSIQYCHRLLNDKGYQALAYSGDHDYLIPYMSTLKWIRALNLTVNDAWRPWAVDGQVAGYTERYANNQAFITFATVKDGGHTAPEYRPKECLNMIDRWLSQSAL